MSFRFWARASRWLVLMGYSPSAHSGAPPPRDRGSGMSWSWTLYRYLAVQFFLGVAVVYGAFLVLAFSIDIVDLLNRTAGHACRHPVVVGMAVLQLPDLGQKMLPFAILAGRRLHLRAAVAQPGTGGDARRRRFGLGFSAAAAGGGGGDRHFRRDRLHAGLGAHVRGIRRRWKRATSRAKPRSCRCRRTGCGCARATRSSNR